MIEAELVQQLAALLNPFLSRLMEPATSASKEAARIAGGKVGEAVWNRAVRAWELIRPQTEKMPEVTQSLQELTEKGDDPRSEAVLSWQLEKVLKDLPPETLAEIRNIVVETNGETHVTIASGERSVAMGKNASNNVIITGDRLDKNI